MALDLNFELGPSDEHSATTRFKAVVREFTGSDLVEAVELRLGSEVLWDLLPLGCVLAINRQQVLYFCGLPTCLGLFFAVWRQVRIAAKNRVSIIKGEDPSQSIKRTFRFFCSRISIVTTSTSDSSSAVSLRSITALVLFFRFAGVKATGV